MVATPVGGYCSHALASLDSHRGMVTKKSHCNDIAVQNLTLRCGEGSKGVAADRP